MSNIEVIICLVLLFMAVPDLCLKIGRPALVFSVFVLFGLLLNPLVQGGVREMLIQAGEVGFLLLLFEVGLEIDLPRFREFLRPLRYAVIWVLVQCPVVFVLGTVAGLNWAQCLLAAAALTACSVGMAHPAWKSLGDVESAAKTFTLHIMVALEMTAVVVLALETTALGHGLHWILLVKLGGIAITIFLIARFSAHLGKLFQLILERTTHWRVHWLVLLVLLICAAGARLGLDAAKTAFFLGLALSTAKHGGLSIEEQIAPISHRFLIPVFFVALGLRIDWHILMDWIALLAVGSAGLLLGLREVLHRRWLRTGGDKRTFLLFCPNLTIVALAAEALVRHGTDPRLTAWLLLTGLFMTIFSLLLLPAGNGANQPPMDSNRDSEGKIPKFQSPAVNPGPNFNCQATS